MDEFQLGCSGWNYPDTPDKGGWTGVFYPDRDTILPNKITHSSLLLLFIMYLA